MKTKIKNITGKFFVYEIVFAQGRNIVYDKSYLHLFSF